MSEVLDRIRHELQQRLEATRAAAQEHERVRAALEALEGAAKQVTREAGKRGRKLAARARPASGGGGSATARPAAKGTASRSRSRTPSRTGTGSGKPPPASRARPKAASPPSTSTVRTGASKSRARARTASKQTRQRAPRGANREAVLGVVRDRPGVTARELAAASGVSGGTLYGLLRRLIDSGELEKRDLPGGQTGYAVGGVAGSASTMAQASRDAHADGAPDASQAAESAAKPSPDGASASAANPAAEG